MLLAGNHEAEFLADPSLKKFADTVADLRRTLQPDQIASAKPTLANSLWPAFGVRLGSGCFSHGGKYGGRSVAQLSADIKHGSIKTFRANALSRRFASRSSAR